MSIAGTNHVVNKLEKTSKAMEGQRLARVIAKKNKNGEYESEHLRESKCVSVPVIKAEFTNEQLVQLSPHITGMLMNAQDELIREKILQGGCTSVNEEEITIGKCIQFLDESAKGNRVTNEYMVKWFTDTYYEPALEFIAALCKFDVESLTADQGTVIETKVNVLASMFAGYASGKYSPDIPKCKAMIRFGEYLREENWDDRMCALIAKSVKIKAEKEAEMSMDALGFA